MINIHYVNNTQYDISLLFSLFREAYKTGELPEGIASLYTIKMLKGINEDGTDRMIINAAYVDFVGAGEVVPMGLSDVNL